MKNQRNFVRNVKDLAETIRFTAKCMADIQDHTKIASTKNQFTSITKTLRDAAQYLNTYVRRGRIGAAFSNLRRTMIDDNSKHRMKDDSWEHNFRPNFKDTWIRSLSKRIAFRRRSSSRLHATLMIPVCSPYSCPECIFIDLEL